MKKKLFYCILFSMLFLTACGTKDAASDVTIEELSDISDFNGYSLNDNAVLISDAKNIYQSDIDEVKQLTAQNSKLLFNDDSIFCALRDFDKLYLFEQITSDRETTVGEGKEYLCKSLDSLGYDSEQFLSENHTILDIHGEILDLDSLNDSDLMSEKGSLWILSTKDCAFNLWPNGLYAFSDGSICEFLGNETASDDFYGNFEFGESEVVKGSLDELSTKSYQLIDKEATIGEMSEYALDFVKTKDLFEYPDEVEMEICDVHVMTLKDKYNFKYYLRRIYNGVPMAFCDFGENLYYTPEDYTVLEDHNPITVATTNGVSSYRTNIMPGLRLNNIREYDKILTLKDAVLIANEKLADETYINVEKVELCYIGKRYKVNVTEDKETGEILWDTREIYVPCWEIQGKITSYSSNMRIFVDAVSGDMFFYTYGFLESE